MNIALIHGHMRKGSTYNISRTLIDKIYGVTEVNELFIPGLIKNGCIGCYSCIEDETRCPFYTEKAKIMRVIEEADLLLFTTPTYCMGPSSQMKQFMDLTFTYWMSHKPRATMFNKRAVVISTCAGAGSKKAIEPIARMLFYWGVPAVHRYGLSVQAMSWDGVPNKKKDKIENDMAKLARKLSTKKPPRVGLKSRFIFNMMGMMQKAHMGSGEKEREYWEDMGWLGKERPWKKKK